MNSVSLSDGLVTMHFEDAAQPIFLEKKGKDYILYGEKNDYPNYLLYLYNSSAKHSAIINGKVDYVCGKGWSFEKEEVKGVDGKADSFIKRANKDGESLDEILGKISLDLEIFNGAYLQIVWNNLQQIADIYHVDYTTVRSNKDNTVFYVADDWVKYNADGSYKTNSNPTITPYNAFNADKKSGTQILYIKKYHPGIDIYTLPTYRGSITWIEVDVEIGNYHLNNVKSGFFVNKMIQFNNGKPTTEEQQKIERMFDNKFGGVRGKKYMFSFNADATKAATVLDLSVAESDKLFDQLNKTTQQEIFTGHRITSPMLFGIKTEGQLGGRTELREAAELFQNTYVNGRQQWLEKIFNALASNAGVTTPLTIQRTEPIAFEFSEAVQAQNMTQDEIREKMGLPPVEKKDNTAAQETINSLNSLSPLVANKVLEAMTADEVRGLIGLSSVNPPLGATQFSAAEDMADAEVFTEFGAMRQKFTVVKSKKVLFSSELQEAIHFAAEDKDISGLQAEVLDQLVKDPLITPEVLSETLKREVKEINAAIKELEKQKLISVTEKKKQGIAVTERKPAKDAQKILKESKPSTRSVKVLYSYEGPKDDKNRPFCAKLLELDRLYSRKDIEQISVRLGYSVWARRGGWYTIPGTNEHRPYCRHSWVSNVVVSNE